ncbi:MAG: hypothetical protein ACTSRG_26810 [Candidatus Helarchaeota archaeon]
MNLPEGLNKEILYNFFKKLKEKFQFGTELITHIKVPEYSLSIPEKKEEFYSIIADYDWNDINYISFFMKEYFFINLDFIEEKIQINCDDNNLKNELKKFIELNLKS